MNQAIPNIQEHMICICSLIGVVLKLDYQKNGKRRSRGGYRRGGKCFLYCTSYKIQFASVCVHCSDLQGCSDDLLVLIWRETKCQLGAQGVQLLKGRAGG